MNKKAQSEMVGFVLIVALVIVALMVFLVISLRKPVKMQESIEIENLLSSLMKQTTGCAIIFEPQYDSVKDLIKSCYDNEKCSNLNKMACEYLNETLAEIMNALLKTESQVSSYKLDISHVTDDESDRILVLGDCDKGVRGAQESISTNVGRILVRLEFC